MFVPAICRRRMDEVRFDQQTLPTEATEVTEDTQRGDCAQTKSGSPINQDLVFQSNAVQNLWISMSWFLEQVI